MSTFADVDPATGETLADVPVSTPADVTRAVGAARAAAASWSERPQRERFEHLRRGAEELGRRRDELAECVTREMGKPLGEAKREAGAWSTHTSEVLDEVAEALAPQILPGDGGDTHLVREPLGVVAAITPWNYPVSMPMSILVPALATGNTVVLKPSELVPLTGAILADCLGGALPDGVLQLVQGPGETGSTLVDSDVDMIGFVGSRETGQRIMAAASGGLKRLVLELGGKDPLVVFDDADLDAAADCAVRHSLRNAGQVCCSVERVYVADAVASDFEALVLEKARAWRHGNGFEQSSRMGPMVSDDQRRKVARQVKDAVESGARLLLGGEPADGPGYFYPATVLADVSPDARLSREETFGPVVALARFDGSEQEAVELANDTPYGLGASVYTGDVERGMRVARRIRSGQVGVNRYLGGAQGTPWVGARQSGFGFLGGVEGHRQFTVPKSITLARRG